MKKTRRKFVLYAVLAVFASLVILLGIINILIFSTAADDADKLTEKIIRASFGPDGAVPSNQGGDPSQGDWNFDKKGLGPMGPDSPETLNSLRYFTVSFDKDGNSTMLAYRISAVEMDAAVEWARSLKKESTGWTRGTYRYRVLKRDGVTFVTVIDQGREMLSAYRILIYSLCGTALGTILSFVILRLVSKKLFAPLEEADRKQRKFIAAAEQEFKLPLTVINADIEIIERENGPSEQTRSVHRQVNKMTMLVRNVGALRMFDEDKPAQQSFAISETLKRVLEKNAERLSQAGVELTTDLDDASFTGDEAAFEKAFGEITENILKYAETKASVSLKSQNGRIKLEFRNDTSLADGGYDQAFDRFVTLENALEGSAGLGLPSVKNVIDMHNGRAHATVENGSFVLAIDL